MRLLEFEGKNLFRKYGIPVPEGTYLPVKEEAEEKASALTYPCIFKAQMLSGGRGKAGLIQRVNSIAEARESFRNILTRKDTFGILAEPFIAIQREFFAAVALDRKLSEPVLMVSVQGGMEVERSASEAMLRVPFCGRRRLELSPVPYLLLSVGLRGKILVQTATVLRALGKLFFEEDALSVEINPLAVAADEKVGPWMLKSPWTMALFSVIRHGVR